jgi:integrase
MTGSLLIKNDKFYMVLNVYEGGKRKRKWIGTGLICKGNKRKAEQMLRETIQQYEQQQDVIASDVTFANYIRHWLKIAKRKVDEVTYQGYEVLANSQILPYFDASNIKLQDVTTKVLQDYIDEKQENGRKDGKGGLSAASLRRHKNILNQTLKEAVKNKLLSQNPCEFLMLPQQEKYQSNFYSVPQLQRLFDAIHDEPLYPLVKITAMYGLRRSELLGLKWDSVDFDGNRLTIRHTVSQVTRPVEKDKTKNTCSYRSFPLVDEARSIFLAAKEKEKENRRLFGKTYHENQYIFKWDDGHLYAPEYVSKKFAKLLDKYELPHIRFHELRHSCASLLINEGFSLKDVQEWMGHADIKMTADIYGHLETFRKKNMANKLSGSLFA